MSDSPEGCLSHVRVYLDPEGWAECECGSTFPAGATRWHAWERWCDHALDEHTREAA